ncbi:MAG: inovirus-type Gp2 protein [Campylobacterales bacterium]|nr:inovirus-type Gp2 protein [Campylobacterales bacterium]
MADKKNINKRIESTKKYIDELSNHHSKLNIVRVDLGYKKPHSENVTLEEANSDLARMFNNMRSKPSVFKDKVGYVCKKEYTKDKGLHIHAIFIYDGQKVQKDAFKGDEIGRYWEQTTKGKGSSHNCNRNEYKRNGIGMLDHRDSDKRKILDEDVISYLCKDEQDIEPIKENEKVRAFTRGTVPKSKGNIGRPRG